MPGIDLTSLGQRVAAARKAAGLTQAELGNATSLDRTAIAKIETGGRRVTALELARISEATHERLDWFLTEAPAPVVSYRAAAGEGSTSTTDRRLEWFARSVEFLQSLGHLEVPVLKPMAPLHDAADAKVLAEQARLLMGLHATDPITDLVGSMAAIGLFAFSEQLGTDAPDAATTLLRQGAVCVVNSSRAVGRRRLALAHELGHYLLADEYTVDWRLGDWAGRPRNESLIDAAARCLLLPGAALAARWPDLAGRLGVRDAAVRIASEYRVDMSTLASRLSELQLADREGVALVRSVTTTRADMIEYDLVVPHDLEGTTLPRPYEKAVLALYRAERISAARATDLLGGTLDEASLPALPPVSEKKIWKFTS